MLQLLLLLLLLCSVMHCIGIDASAAAWLIRTCTDRP
jgi:hypothetical protein